MNIIPGQPFELPERYWNKIDKGSDDECWPYRSVVWRNGYGIFFIKGKPERAHRLMLMSLGIDLRGLVARHTCDYPPCCNPKHLLPGTLSDNNMDAVVRKRWTQGKPGSACHLAKLNEEKVLKIREAWAALPKYPSGRVGPHFLLGLAKFYKTDRRTINDIVRRVTWQHV